jgi:threonine dehydrogenase-like Zn-dependent dehydrogenase
MQSIWLENHILTLRSDVPVPALTAGQALVRVRQAGICGTDLALRDGYYPFTGVLGHEFVGEVMDAPEAPEWVARRVVGEINVACTTCAECKAGRSMHCERRTVLGIRDWNGAFAEYLKLPLANLHRVPDNLSDEKAVFTEPLAAALEIQQQVPGLSAARVLVVGAGRLGQLVAQTLALTGCDLQVWPPCAPAGCWSPADCLAG